MYPSATYRAVKARRLRSIQRRATRELSEAFAAGRLSLNKAEVLSQLSPARQRRILAQEQQKEESQRLAALAISSILAQESRPDLVQVAQTIAETIRCADPGSIVAKSWQREAALGPPRRSAATCADHPK
jgi:hypothetical protein